jgi:hypothetical protein
VAGYCIGVPSFELSCPVILRAAMETYLLEGAQREFLLQHISRFGGATQVGVRSEAWEADIYADMEPLEKLLSLC